LGLIFTKISLAPNGSVTCFYLRKEIALKASGLNFLKKLKRSKYKEYVIKVEILRDITFIKVCFLKFKNTLGELT